MSPVPMGKIKTAKEVGAIAESLRKGGRKIVTTNGVFDILHLGHITYLQKARELGDVLIVGVNSDASVKRIKGPKRPLNDELSRAACLASLECVDYVVVFNEDDPINLLSNIKPHIHVKGGDYKGKEDSIVEKGLVERDGGKIVLVEMVKGYSTSSLIRKIIGVFKE